LAAIGRIEADLEGFARDLRELLAHPSRFAPSPQGGQRQWPGASPPLRGHLAFRCDEG
jgi:hypothetical protein